MTGPAAEIRRASELLRDGTGYGAAVAQAVAAWMDATVQEYDAPAPGFAGFMAGEAGGDPDPALVAARAVLASASPPDGFPARVELRDHFTMYSEHLAMLGSRKKTTTIRHRPGALDLPAGDVLPLYITSGDGDRAAAGSVRVRSVTVKQYGGLDANDVWRDGFASLSGLAAALGGFYPELGPADWVTIYELQLVDGGDQ